jgi:hypothetical protein
VTDCLQGASIQFENSIHTYLMVRLYRPTVFEMSTDDFTVHTEDCDEVDDGMPISDLPDEVTSIDDLECHCWNGVDSLAEFE